MRLTLRDTAVAIADDDIRSEIEERLVDLLPIIVSGRYLKRQPFYVIGTFYTYVRDVLALLVGIGLGFPGATILQRSRQENLGGVLSSLLWYEYVPAVLLIVAASLLKVYISRESVEKRMHLVRECETQLALQYGEVEEALQSDNPIRRLRAIRNSVTALKAHHVRERSYLFPSGISERADRDAKSLARQLSETRNRWK